MLINQPFQITQINNHSIGIHQHFPLNQKPQFLHLSQDFINPSQLPLYTNHLEVLQHPIPYFLDPSEDLLDHLLGLRFSNHNRVPLTGFTQNIHNLLNILLPPRLPWLHHIDITPLLLLLKSRIQVQTPPCNTNANPNRSPRAKTQPNSRPRGGAGLSTDGLLNSSLDGRAREGGFLHDPTNTWVIQDGYDKLLQFDLNRQQGLLLLLWAASALMGLSPLEGCDEGVGERRLRRWRGGGLGGGEAVERDAEAELEGSTLKRVGGVGVGPDTGLPEQSSWGGEKRRRHMKRRRLAMTPTRRLGD
uniref:Uncharacterized protein n=1 Tax=Opuntia streptacantha TaxID=393608 RepID=A0A7C9ANK3_OPUST